MWVRRDFRKASSRLRPGESAVSPENWKMNHGRLAASTEFSAANSHCTASLRACGSTGISASLRSARCSRIAPLSKIDSAPSVSHGTWPKGWCAKWSASRERKETACTW